MGTTYAIDFIPVDARGQSAPWSWRAAVATEAPEISSASVRPSSPPARGGWSLRTTANQTRGQTVSTDARALHARPIGSRARWSASHRGEPRCDRHRRGWSVHPSRAPSLGLRQGRRRGPCPGGWCRRRLWELREQHPAAPAHPGDRQHRLGSGARTPSHSGPPVRPLCPESPRSSWFDQGHYWSPPSLACRRRPRARTRVIPVPLCCQDRGVGAAECAALAFGEQGAAESLIGIDTKHHESVGIESAPGGAHARYVESADKTNIDGRHVLKPAGRSRSRQRTAADLARRG